MPIIAEITTHIRYAKGETNSDADTLAGPSVSAIGSASVINYKELSEVQAFDAEFTRLRHLTSSTLDFQLLKTFDNILVRCDVWTGHARPNVTAKFRRKVFSSLHDLEHL